MLNVWVVNMKGFVGLPAVHDQAWITWMTVMLMPLTRELIKDEDSAICLAATGL